MKRSDYFKRTLIIVCENEPFKNCAINWRINQLEQNYSHTGNRTHMGYINGVNERVLIMKTIKEKNKTDHEELY